MYARRTADKQHTITYLHISYLHAVSLPELDGYAVYIPAPVELRYPDATAGFVYPRLLTLPSRGELAKQLARTYSRSLYLLYMK